MSANESTMETELRTFAAAANWKRYWASQIAPYLRGAVLEVGAGLGANTRLLRSAAQSRWVCIEPDERLARRLGAGFEEGQPGLGCEVLAEGLGSLGPEERFDAILYVDVLEHIEHDAEELRLAASHLNPGGRLIVLSPAHQWLYSPFDAAIGHFRRYTKRSLSSRAPESLELKRLAYLDAAGVLASLMNRCLLRSTSPTQAQVRFWDRWLVPASVWLDWLLRFSLGKTVLGIWEYPG